MAPSCRGERPNDIVEARCAATQPADIGAPQWRVGRDDLQGLSPSQSRDVGHPAARNSMHLLLMPLSTPTASLNSG